MTRLKLLPVLLLALTAPLVMAIALHRSGSPLGQARLPILVEAPALAGQQAELRLTYRARRCLPLLTCRADWSGGPERPIEIERRSLVQLGPGRHELVRAPRTLLSLASFELLGASLRTQRGDRIDLLLAAGAPAPGPDGLCQIAAPLEGPPVSISPRCERVELVLGGR